MDLPTFHIAGDRIILNYLDERARSWPGDFIIVALDIETGQVVWQTPVTSKYDNSIDSSHLDEERLYLVYDYAAHAFDLETGMHLWSTFDPEHRPGTDVFYTFWPWEPTDPLLWHSTAGEVLALDPRTGAILYRQPEESWEFHIRKDGIDIETMKTPGGAVRAVDLQTGQVLWERPELGGLWRISRWPAFVGDDIVLHGGHVCYDVLRLDMRTGEAVWYTNTGDYISNFAISGSRLYVLRDGLTLVAFDVETGAVAGALQFKGVPVEAICTRARESVYWVIAEEPYVAVYFGDTDEVIMFKEQLVP